MTWDIDDSWEDDVASFSCPICGKSCVPAVGNTQSKVLIIGEFPGDEEILAGKPFAGHTGRILKAELAYMGFDLFSSARVANLWQHTPNKNQDCFNHGVGLIRQEAKGKKAILLVGSDVSKYFLDKSVMEVNGLRVQSNLLSAPIQFAMINPAIVFQKNEVVGEVRFALKNFISALEEIR